MGVGGQNMGAYHPAASPTDNASSGAQGSDILDSDRHELKLEKSNILLLGPTGSGNFVNSKHKVKLLSNAWLLTLMSKLLSNADSLVLDFDVIFLRAFQRFDLDLTVLYILLNFLHP